MKSKLFLLTIVTLLFIGCADAQKKENKMSKKTLVAYFSATGTTKSVAENLAKATSADLFEIVPEQLYTSADLDWTNKQSRSTIEMNDKQSRPAIKNKVQGWESYDVIYIGFPIWWYTAPTIINTFLEQYDLTGKTIIPFATSGGSSIGKATKDLKAAYPQATWEEGLLLNGTPSVDSLKRKIEKKEN